MRDTGDYYGCGHNGGDYGDGTPYLLDVPSWRPMSDSLVWVKHTLLLLGGRLPPVDFGGIADACQHFGHGMGIVFFDGRAGYTNGNGTA